MTISHSLRRICEFCLLLLFTAPENFGVEGVCPPGCYCDDVRLEVVCDSSGLDVVPITLNPSIQRLALPNNKIKSIDNAFHVYHDLLYVDLSKNKLISLQNKSFEVQRRLNELHLDHNKISTVTNKTWTGLKALTILTLRANFLQTLEERTFSTVLRLRELDLGENQLQYIHPQTFAGLEDLKILNLDDNRLATSAPLQPIFNSLPNLAELHLGNNDLSDITDGLFSSLDSLTVLDLSAARIARITGSTLTGLEKLRSLKLDGNELQEIPSQALEKLSFLEELSLGKNPIKAIENGAFAALHRLRSIEISHCDHLKQVQNDAFMGLHQLSSVKLTSNRDLKSLPDGLFTSSLTTLDLSYNSLTQISEKLAVWDNIEHFNVNGNPLYCNCDMLWLVDTLKRLDKTQRDLKANSQKQKDNHWEDDHEFATEIRLWSENSIESEEVKPKYGSRGRGKVPTPDSKPTFSYLKAEHRPGPVCDGPSSLRNTHIFELNEQKLGCSDWIPHELLIALIALIGTGFIACAAMLWCYRRKIAAYWLKQKRDPYSYRWSGSIHNGSLARNPVVVDTRQLPDYRPYEGECMINLENSLKPFPRTEL